MAKQYLISDFLKRIKRPIDLEDETEYKLVTIKMNHKGVVLREYKKGCDIKSGMYLVKQGDFILSGIDARNGAFGIVPPELDNAVVTNDFWYFQIDENIILKELFLELTATTWFDEICKKGSDGTTQRIRLQKDKFFNQLVWLPEKKEQPKILREIKEFKTKQNSLINEYKEQKTTLEQLKQSILQEAIQGKLTEEWRKDNHDVEPASELLKRIKAEKKQLIKDKKIKKEKLLPPINKDEIPFELPNGWVWCRLGEICTLKSGNSYQFSISNELGIPYVKVGDMNIIGNAQDVRFSSTYFKREDVDGSQIIPSNSIIFPKRGGAIATNKKCLVLSREILVDSNTMAITVINIISLRYVYLWFQSIDLGKLGDNSVIPQVNNKDILPLLFPLPPFEEQQLIVRKVKALLEKCNELNNEIDNLNKHSKSILKALFNETFSVQL